MTKINPLLEAMSEIDDNIITNTTKKTGKRPLLIVAAAAAALALIMGCKIVYDYRSGVDIGNKPAFDFDYQVQEGINLLTHEELMEMGAVYNERGDTGYYDFKALPSEVFQKFNVDPLTNDNFIEEECEIRVDYMLLDEEEQSGQLLVNYWLYDKASDVNVKFGINCRLSEETSIVTGLADLEGVDSYEVLTLNNGSQALIYGYYSRLYEGEVWHGTFSQDGIIYEIHIYNTNINEVKQVLSDLGVL